MLINKLMLRKKIQMLILMRRTKKKEEEKTGKNGYVRVELKRSKIQRRM